MTALPYLSHALEVSTDDQTLREYEDVQLVYERALMVHLPKMKTFSPQTQLSFVFVVFTPLCLVLLIVGVLTTRKRRSSGHVELFVLDCASPRQGVTKCRGIYELRTVRQALP